MRSMAIDISRIIALLVLGRDSTADELCYTDGAFKLDSTSTDLGAGGGFVEGLLCVLLGLYVVELVVWGF